MGLYSTINRLRGRSSQPVHSSARKSLVRVLRNRSTPRQGLASRGFAMLLILLLVLTVLTTTMSLTSRTTAGMAMNSVQGKLRLARDAAENGLVISIGELNKPANRMLVGSVPLNHWATNDFRVRTDGNDVTVAPNAVIYPRDCMIFTNESPWNRIYQTTEEALLFATNNPPRRIMRNSGNDQYFRVLGIQLTDAARNPINRETGLAANNAFSFLTMTVEGIYSAAVAPTTAAPNPINSVHYTIQQEYQLAPRCCSTNRYPVDEGNAQPACAAAGLAGNFKPEWMARSISQAGIFKTNQ